MDFFNLLKEFSKQEKDILSCFCILLPLCFTMLYFYIPNFKTLDVYLQVIFASALSIGCVYLSLVAHLIPLQINGLEISVNKPMLLLPTIAVSFTLIPVTDLHVLGYQMLNVTILAINVIFGFICFVACKRQQIKQDKSREC